MKYRNLLPLILFLIANRTYFSSHPPPHPSPPLFSSPQVYNSLPDLPWDIKPLWGILTDSFPIAGSHTRSWIAITSLLGVFCWGTVAAVRLPTALAATALVGTNVAMALPDVVTDAAVAMRSRAKPQFAADLQVRNASAFSTCGLRIRVWSFEESELPAVSKLTVALLYWFLTRCSSKRLLEDEIMSSRCECNLQHL